MFDILKNYRKKLGIKRKLLLINMAIAILPVAIFGILITRVYEDTVDKRIRQSVGDTSMVIADRITRILKDTENCSNYLTVNINKVMGKKDVSKKLTLAEQKAITNELYVAKIVFDEIDSIAFIAAERIKEPISKREPPLGTPYQLWQPMSAQFLTIRHFAPHCWTHGFMWRALECWDMRLILQNYQK